MRANRSLLACVWVLTIGVVMTYSQTPEPVAAPGAVLLDEYGTLSHCDFTSRLDNLLAELSSKPDHTGYILNYKSVDELPGDRNSYYRESWMASHISFRGFDASRIVLERGGYLDEIRTQIWIVPPGGKAPEGLATLPPPKVPDKKTFLFAKNNLSSDIVVANYELGGGVEEMLPDFVLETVKARERAEQEETERQWAAEQAEEEKANPRDPAETQTEPSNHDGHAANEMATAEPVENRSAEQRDADRFKWADVGVAELIASKKGSSGVIIFYADSERYDIATLKQFVARGRDLLAGHSSVARSRLKVVFGGYRPDPEVDFWFIPAKGKVPVPTPAVRPVEEPEVETEN